MNLDTHERDGWTVVAASGEIDVVTAPSIRSEVVNLVVNGSTDIVLDFGRVDFIDSFGLGVMVGALKRVHSHEGRLRVVIGEPRVRGVLELTGIDRVLELYASVDDAIADDTPPAAHAGTELSG
ncbi:STAS domain-containing protein [Actinomarinicola tropica]|uniref:Anti-sigma factor antagonist n=1 Tax=Actinomarinicola tropica TaxID=2789776 RepID=A0A5Q2RTH2_9ACTN|nr:STAS domain-containing protein [Actinomarinicola tropica]QGG96515.1 anti-sigma factor antagonist [Actinomarinicola tropica]